MHLKPGQPQPSSQPGPVRSPRKKKSAAPKSLRDQAYEAIKHLIITCALRPGEYVNESYLSSLIGVGRTPVHQAIDRLMLEDMIAVMPRKGAIVKPMSLEEVLQIIDVRHLNEAHCVRLAAERADDTDIAAMNDILQRATQWIAARNTEQLMLVDREFHLALARASRNIVLSDVLRRLHERSLRFWFVSLAAPGYHESVQEQHEAVLTAIRRHDPDAAEAAMRNHIESFRRNIASLV